MKRLARSGLPWSVPRLRLGLAISLLLVTTSLPDPLGDAGHVTLFIGSHRPGARPAVAQVPISAYETDVQRIANVFEALELPLPTRITLRLYSSPELFAAGLVDDAGLKPIFARTVGMFAAGVALDDTLLVLEPEFRRGPRAWLRLVAHEMTHLSQIQLAGGADCGARWLGEGMAEWVAFTVLDRLGVAAMSVERDTIVTRARGEMATDGVLFNLDQIDEPRLFLEHVGTIGAQPVYRLAFLLASHLIEEHGLEAVVEYFRVCPARTGWRASFEEVFGQRLVDFERDVIEAAKAGDPRPSTIPFI